MHSFEICLKNIMKNLVQQIWNLNFILNFNDFHTELAKGSVRRIRDLSSRAFQIALIIAGLKFITAIEEVFQHSNNVKKVLIRFIQNRFKCFKPQWSPWTYHRSIKAILELNLVQFCWTLQFWIAKYKN